MLSMSMLMLNVFDIEFCLGLQDRTKPRADSLNTSPSSGIEATTASGSFDGLQGSSSCSTPSNSPWSALSYSGGRRQSKQAKLAARQTELKRSVIEYFNS